LLAPAIAAITLDFAGLQQSILDGGVATRITILYLVASSRLYVLYGTGFPFLYSLAALCRGESQILTPPETAGRDRKYAAKRRLSIYMWWFVPLVFACVILIGLVRKP
jgi:hypothetical protein